MAARHDAKCPLCEETMYEKDLKIEADDRGVFISHPGVFHNRPMIGRGDPRQGDVYNDRRNSGGTQPRRKGPAR